MNGHHLCVGIVRDGLYGGADHHADSADHQRPLSAAPSVSTDDACSAKQGSEGDQSDLRQHIERQTILMAMDLGLFPRTVHEEHILLQAVGRLFDPYEACLIKARLGFRYLRTQVERKEL